MKGKNMKKYDEIQHLPLVDVFNKYINLNDLSLAYASRCTKIPYTTLSDWSRGLHRISAKNAIKVKKFLQGDFIISADYVINRLLKEKSESTDKID